MYINDSKPINSSVNDSKPSTDWFSGMGFLLTQSLGYLLLENGGKIMLDQSYNNKPTNSWDLDTK